MPFTPLHLGPGAVFKAVGGRHFSFMVFGGAQVLMDLEPLVRMTLGTPLVHGITHSYALAVPIGLFAGLIGKPISAWVLRWLKIPHHPLTWAAAFAGGLVGTLSHVALDSIMHSDMAPLYPFAAGLPLHGLTSIDALQVWCLALGVVGGIGVALRCRAQGRA